MSVEEGASVVAWVWKELRDSDRKMYSYSKVSVLQACKTCSGMMPPRTSPKPMRS